MTSRRFTDRRGWSIVLAAGSGSRLAELTVAGGRHVPKQFCSLDYGPTLLEHAIARARAVTGLEHTVVVVATEHEEWWAPLARRHPEVTFVSQPCNRGTAAGLFLPLDVVRRRDPDAVVLVLASDQAVDDEARLRHSMNGALQLARLGRRVVLLGFEPRGDGAELGWIVPQHAGLRHSTVARFWEKPGEAARKLRAEGALVNGFILCAQLSSWMTLFERYAPEVALAFRDGVPARYDAVPRRDLSRDVLERATRQLFVLRSEDCGWVDLGVPARVAARADHALGVPVLVRRDA